jgi:hypothetical protein
VPVPGLVRTTRLVVTTAATAFGMPSVGSGVGLGSDVEVLGLAAPAGLDEEVGGVSDCVNVGDADDDPTHATRPSASTTATIRVHGPVTCMRATLPHLHCGSTAVVMWAAVRGRVAIGKDGERLASPAPDPSHR